MRIFTICSFPCSYNIFTMISGRMIWAWRGIGTCSGAKKSINFFGGGGGGGADLKVGDCLEVLGMDGRIVL